MPRKRSKHAPAAVKTSIRQREVAELRAQKLTMQEIADRLGISKPAVHQHLEAWDKNFKAENRALADEMRDNQLDELRLLKRQWFPRVNALDADAKDLSAYLRLVALEAKIAGTEAPVRSEISGPDGGAITVSNDLSHLSAEQLLQIEELLAGKPAA